MACHFLVAGSSSENSVRGRGQAISPESRLALPGVSVGEHRNDKEGNQVTTRPTAGCLQHLTTRTRSTAACLQRLTEGAPPAVARCFQAFSRSTFARKRCCAARRRRSWSARRAITAASISTGAFGLYDGSCERFGDESATTQKGTHNEARRGNEASKTNTSTVF